MKQCKIINALIILTVIALLGACASTPKPDPRVTALENSYNDLMRQTEVIALASQEISRAERALNLVRNRPKSMKDNAYAYSLYATDRLIQLAEFSGRQRLAEEQRQQMVREQEQLILLARTREAERARTIAEQAKASAAEALAVREKALAEAAEAAEMRDMAQKARIDAEEKRLLAEEAAKSAMTDAEKAKTKAEAEAARADAARAEAEAEAARADAARAEAEAAKAEMQNLRSQLEELEAKQTERGLLITLGDVLFEFNKSELRPGTTRNLEPLAKALLERPDQTVIVEGHTDSIGSKEYNMKLSEARALSVKNYLVKSGVSSDRISIEGMGPDYPVSSNNTESGRQQNRRVEVILPNISPEQ